MSPCACLRTSAPGAVEGCRRGQGGVAGRELPLQESAARSASAVSSSRSGRIGLVGRASSRRSRPARQGSLPSPLPMPSGGSWPPTRCGVTLPLATNRRGRLALLDRTRRSTPRSGTDWTRWGKESAAGAPDCSRCCGFWGTAPYPSCETATLLDPPDTGNASFPPVFPFPPRAPTMLGFR